MIILNMNQRSEEWSQARLGCLTASDAYKIYVGGKGLETLCYQKCAELLTGKSENHFINDDIARGIEYEHEAKLAYELTTGFRTQDIGFVKPCADSLVGCSPDAVLFDYPGLVEFKNRNGVNHLKRIISCKIETEALCQMNMQMLICERNFCDYVNYNRNYIGCGKELVIERIHRDPEMVKKLDENLKIGEELIKKILRQANMAKLIKI